jgi:methionyl-tRNA formyltransferase
VTGVARLAFLGTPDMAVPPLRALVDDGHDVALCITRPDRRRGRGSAVTPSPVKEAALELGIPVSHSMEDVADAGVELAVVVAYGRIIPAALLARVPMVNLHFSLLPRWRGAAPVERALLAGDEETGVCLMKLEEGLDTGPVYAHIVVPIGDTVDLPTLRDQLVTAGCALLVAGLRQGVAGLPEPVPQWGEPTIASKLTPEDFRLQWEQPAAQLHRVVRLGRAWTTFRGKRLGILRATPVAAPADAGSGGAGAGAAGVAGSGGAGVPGTLVGTIVCAGDGALALEEVQPESRGPMGADDWVRGVRLLAGERLGSD